MFTMKPFAVACLLIIILPIACSKGGNNDDGQNPPPPPPPGSAPTISSTSPEYVFWGKELTINGTNFSTTANDNIVYFKGNKSCDPDTTWQKATVVSATATQLKVKVPFIKKPNGVFCGNDWARVRVTVGNKSVMREEAVKMVGPLEIGLCHPFGVTIGEYPNTYRPGDSSVMSAHLYTLYAKESGYYDKIKLSIGNSGLNTVDRYFQGATCGGLTFVLDPLQYTQVTNCDKPNPDYLGDPARKFTFIARIDGTDIADTTECYVFNHPRMVITGTEGATVISKLAGGTPFIKVKGKYMYFNEIAWSSPGELTFHTGVNGLSLTDIEHQVSIPLSLMTAGKSYAAVGKAPCGKEVPLFGVSIIP
jgi:hypothetical protein